MYKQGDIVWVSYPFSDNPTMTKARPALVIRNEISNNLDNDLLIAQITSILRKDKFSVMLTNESLSIPISQISEVRCNKIVTVRKDLVLGKLSSLKMKKMLEVVAKVMECVEIKKSIEK